MRKVLIVFAIIISIIGINSVYAANTTVKMKIISQETKSQLVEIKDKELQSIEDYNEAYGSNTYGLVAYILDKVRVYSIPVAFLRNCNSGYLSICNWY